MTKKTLLNAIYSFVCGFLATVIGGSVSLLVGGNTQERIISWVIGMAISSIAFGVFFVIKS